MPHRFLDCRRINWDENSDFLFVAVVVHLLCSNNVCMGMPKKVDTFMRYVAGTGHFMRKKERYLHLIYTDCFKLQLITISFIPLRLPSIALEPLCANISEKEIA